MEKILWLISSPRGDASVSQQAGNKVIELLTHRYPDVQVVVRELVKNPVPFIDTEFAEKMFMTAEDASNEPSLQVSEALIAEVVEAGAIILSTPMHNFTVPAPLKAWIDQVVRADRTFKRTPVGKVGLLKDKPVYILVATGGIVLGDDATQPDFLTPYLKAIFSTIGIHDISFAHLERAGAEKESFDTILNNIRSELEIVWG